MSKVYAFMAEGFEEVECLSVVDILRRAGVETTMVSVSGSLEVTGSHQITVKADALFSRVNCKEADLLFLPGGVPGTPNLLAHQGLCQALKEAAEDGRRLAAICAAPSILGQLHLLEGKEATCYPGWEDKLLGAVHKNDGVVTDGKITTGRGMGYGVDLGLELVRILVDEATSEDLKEAIQYNWQ